MVQLLIVDVAAGLQSFHQEPKKRFASLAKDRIAVGIRTVTKKLNFSNDYIERNKKIGATTVRRYVKSTKWGKVAYKEKVKPMLSQKNINDIQ